MKIGQTIQCQACGASSVTRNTDQSMLECQYCGAMMAYSEQSNNAAMQDSIRKPTKIGLMLIMLPIVVIVLIVVFWLVFQNIRKQTGVDTYQVDNTVLTANKDKKVTNQPTETEAQVPSAASIAELLIIQNQVSGTTSNGGQFWIIGIKNTSDQNMIKPGVMLSLFNPDGQRIEEQGGWSMREVLKAGEETAVLVYVSDVPAEVVKQKFSTFASQSSFLSLNQAELKVEDYQVSHKNSRYEIIGDVVNDNDTDVKYVRLMAVAYNEKGEPIGMGNAFSSIKDLAPNQSSGFKVTVGTFLTGVPVSWRLWAIARS